VDGEGDVTEPFRVLLADPPWLFRDKLPGRGRGASKHYSCMGIDALKRFELPPLAPDCVLFLWRCSAMPQEALDLIKAWGFTIKSEIVWEKCRPCGPCKGAGSSVVRGKKTKCRGCDGLGMRPFFGMGRYVRNSHETCHIAARGRPQRRNATSARNILSRFKAPMPIGANGRPIHSAKPDAIHELIERMYPGPYVELFARRHRPGWVCLGNELPETKSETPAGGAAGVSGAEVA
jgi:N6-adenosine-specific RNA methylase IME4